MWDPFIVETIFKSAKWRLPIFVLKLREPISYGLYNYGPQASCSIKDTNGL